jgi:hypothetical protein
MFTSILFMPSLTSNKNSALDDFVPLFGPVLDDVSRDTGHTFMVLWAGPEPVAGGAIQVRR